ncbi:MAG: sodium-dependent transporter [Tissierella sp.]|uniref:sodium-dependent transporter n=1 Tax=Tissierella sp. TaxID=41274 RepID=UPI003F97934A
MVDKNNNNNPETLENDSRETFGSKFGFVLACVGSAVGMGNIWLFPYRVGEFGGAAFLIPYFIFVVVIGFTGVIGEMSFGRAMRTGPLGSFKKAFKRRNKDYGATVGMIPVIGSLGIAIGYSVVVGWILRFLIGSFTGSMLGAENSGAYFGQIAGTFGSTTWHLLGLLILLVILSLGVADGIEKVNKVLMPAFFGLFLILAIRIAFLPGAMEGYKFMFVPRWEALLSPKTWVFALGQAFFSLSLAGSGTVVYGSYLKKNEDVVDAAKYIVIFDVMAAMLAALVILPAVFAYNLDPAAGPPLMFITLPEVFKQMPLGNLFAIVFFVAVFFAATTSLMNLMETPIEAIQEKFKISRLKSVSLVIGLTALVGVFIENGDVVSIWMDVISIYVIPLGALLAGVVFFWIAGEGFAREAVQMGREKKLGAWFEPMTKYVFVGLTILVYIMGIIYGGIG